MHPHDFSLYMTETAIISDLIYYIMSLNAARLHLTSFKPLFWSVDISHPGMCRYAQSANNYEHGIDAFGVALLLPVLDLNEGNVNEVDE